ncbi:MAG TPA: SRPBCC domain-containing protein [Gemmatimonadales bacterium]
MTTHPTTGAARSVERQIEIAAPPHAVWRALTDAEELIRWFPLEARITPGHGGTVWMRWDESETVDDRIDVWEPERRLRLVGKAGSWAGIATDYFLQGKSGGTVLRVVSSGFGDDASDDEVAQGFGYGWDFELRGLRHYLERHRGVRRVVAWARARYNVGYEEAWARLTGSGGFFGAAGLPYGESGVPCALTTVTGDRLDGVVMLAQAPYQFAAIAGSWNDALFRAHLYGGTAMLWLSTYGVETNRVRELERQWQAALDEIFPAV